MARDQSLDTLRGALILIICINHIGSVFSKLTTGTIGFVTAMEGFIFLSGLVAGLVYAKRYHTLSSVAFLKATTGRSLTLYKYHMIIAVGLAAAAALWGPALRDSNWPWPPLFEQSFMETLLRYALLFPATAHMQILPIYCLLILFLPVLFFTANRWGTAALFGGSVALWLAAQAGAQLNVGSYNILAWQLLFVGGVCCGIFRYEQRDHSPALGPVAGVLALTVAAGCFALNLLSKPGLLLAVGFDRATIDAGAAAIGGYLDKPNLGPLRVLDFIALAAVFYFLVRHFRPLFEVSWLAYLGRFSLQIFSYQIFVVFLLAALEIHLLTAPLWLNLLVTALTVLGAFATCWLFDAEKRWRGRRARAKSAGLLEQPS